LNNQGRLKGNDIMGLNIGEEEKDVDSGGVIAEIKYVVSGDVNGE